MRLNATLQRILGVRQAYRRTFGVDDGKIENRDAQVVAADLRRFCNADKPTYRVSPITRQVDEKAMLIAEGRREVWLRIQGFLHVSDADLARLQEHNERTEQHAE